MAVGRNKGNITCQTRNLFSANAYKDGSGGQFYVYYPIRKVRKCCEKGFLFTVTFKRYNGYDRPKPREGRPPLPEPETYLCLMRAQTKSKKISTIVRQEDVPKMMNMYAQFMKSNIDGLKRVKKVKSKAKAAKG